MAAEEGKATSSQEEHEDSSNISWKKVWLDFAANTTINGLFQIVEDQPFKTRRFIWLVLVIGGMTLFAHQFITSVIHYRSWPVNVNVKVNYNDTLKFPSITICNQNVYRTTAAAAAGRYDLIRNMYTEHKRAISNRTLQAEFDNTTMEELYRQTAHMKEDLIVECVWKDKPCTSDNFTLIMTDHGPCFTFNTGKEGEELEVDQTGAKHGLQLRLNVEQYEYMPGPNMAAGLKLLVHDQREVPLVRDLGQAIPPGFHAFSGLSILKVLNLPHPHGKCDDSVKLQYFDHYSVSACHVDCAAKYFMRHCGCREVYTPEISPGFPEVCTTRQQTECVQPLRAAFGEDKRLCHCPIPCSKIMHLPTITYGAISNFDMLNLMKSDMTVNLSKSYLQAREAVQRVDDRIIANDVELVRRVEMSIDNIHKVFSEIGQTLNRSSWEVEHLSRSLRPRLHFHWRWGLEKVKFTIEHGFIRGFEVMDERCLEHIASRYQEFLTKYATMINQTLSTDPSGVALKRAIYAFTERDLYAKTILINQALANITGLHNAFTTGERLLFFKASPSRRYDLAYVPVELIRADNREYVYYVKWLRRASLMRDQLGIMQEIAVEARDNNSIDTALLAATQVAFSKQARSYNYYHFLYKERIVQGAQERIEKKIAEFQKLNGTYHSLLGDLERGIASVVQDLHTLRTGPWSSILSGLGMAKRYLQDKSLTKTSLAEDLTSEKMDATYLEVRHFFTEIHSRARSLKNIWVRMSYTVKALWSNMIEESTTKLFYGMMYNDTHVYLSNRTGREDLVRILAYMTDMMRANFRNLSSEEIITQTNGDFHLMDLDKKISELDTYFMSLNSKLDILKAIQGSDENFYKAFESLRTSMREFLQANELSEDFYKSNFIQISMYFQEKRYEEIEQQIGYSMVNLLSDIGGSIGLFVGASVLTFFEVADVIIHTLAKRYC